MNSDSFTQTIVTTAKPEEVYSAVTEDFEKWWGPVTPSILQVGDVGVFQVPSFKTTWTFKAINLEKSKRVELECISANHFHEGAPEAIREEWLGTVLQWEIETEKTGSKVTFTHKGLSPLLHCYEMCSVAWTHFVTSSLQSYLNSGIGTPTQTLGIQS